MQSVREYEIGSWIDNICVMKQGGGGVRNYGFQKPNRARVQINSSKCCVANGLVSANMNSSILDPIEDTIAKL